MRQLLFAVAFLSLAAVAIDLTLNGDEVWVISPSEPAPVSSALLLAQKDAYMTLGVAPVVLSAPPAPRSLPAGTTVVFMGTPGAAPWLAAFDLSGCFVGWESHCVKAFPPGASGYASIVATGQGDRGAIYGALSFSEAVLGVNPWALFTDDPPAYVGSVSLNASLELLWGPPKYKYRGLFFNDEVCGSMASFPCILCSLIKRVCVQDLLANHRPDPLGQAAVDLRMYDDYMTTLLRLKGNMIVPATNPFPDQVEEGWRDARFPFSLPTRYHPPLNRKSMPSPLPRASSSRTTTMTWSGRMCMRGHWIRCDAVVL